MPGIIVTYAHRYKHPPRRQNAQAAQIASPIVTARKPRVRFGDAPDLSGEEHQRRGDAADALFREIVRRART
jgi:hypothetical protein